MSAPRSWLRRLLLSLLAIALVLAVAREVLLRRIDPPGGLARGEHTRSSLLSEAGGRPRVALGARLRGTLLDAGGRAAAGMVTLRELGSGRRDTVYAIAGEFSWPPLPPGSYELRAHDGGDHAATPRRLTLPADVAALTVTLDQPSSEPRPAAYYATKLVFPSERVRDDFQIQCRYCHNIGNPFTRKPRAAADWRVWIRRMQGMGALPSAETLAALPVALERGLDGAFDPSLPPPALPGEALAKAHLVEWPMGVGGGYIHDLAVGQGGWIYAVDMSLDRIEAINTLTDARVSWAIDPRGHPRGGYMRGAAQPVGTSGASQGPHSVELGDDGRLWITHSLGSEIAAFDPASGDLQHWSLPRGAYYPHSLRVRAGHVWFTIALSNQLGHLDVSTGAVEVLPLPTADLEQSLGRNFLGITFGLASLWPGQDRHVDLNLARLSGSGGRTLPLPYGIDLAPDGSVYWTQLYGDTLGRYEPKTGALSHWSTPFVGPRRLAVDQEGKVWIPAFGSGLLARFDPVTEQFTRFPLPSIPAGGDAPYALGVHPMTGDVWVTSTTQDVLYRFAPKSETFTVYPLPTRGTFMREIEFGPRGEICTTYSNLPDRHMPDGAVKLMCLMVEDP